MAMLKAEHGKADPPGELELGHLAEPYHAEDPFNQEAADYYLERFMESAGRFDTAISECDRELGEIPLPVSMPRLKAGCSLFKSNPLRRLSL